MHTCYEFVAASVFASLSRRLLSTAAKAFGPSWGREGGLAWSALQLVATEVAGLPRMQAQAGLFCLSAITVHSCWIHGPPTRMCRRTDQKVPQFVTQLFQLEHGSEISSVRMKTAWRGICDVRLRKSPDCIRPRIEQRIPYNIP